MDLSFKSYDSIYEKKELSKKNDEIIFNSFLEKIVSINKNLNKESVRNSLEILPEKNFIFGKDKSYIIVNIYFNLFDILLELKTFIYYNENGKYSHFISAFESGSKELFEILNLYDFKNHKSILSFRLNSQYFDYSIDVKINNSLKKSLFHNKNLFVKFSFKNDSSLQYKSLEINEKDSYAGSSHPVKLYGSISDNLLFLYYFEHILNDNDIDSLFFSKKLESNNDLSKEIINSFIFNIENNKQKFLEYMKVVEMSNY